MNSVKIAMVKEEPQESQPSNMIDGQSEEDSGSDGFDIPFDDLRLDDK